MIDPKVKSAIDAGLAAFSQYNSFDAKPFASVLDDVFASDKDFMSKVAMLDEVKAGIPSHVTADLTQRPALTPAEFRERMSGNICRCGAYSNIQEAIAEVAGVKA